jgi:hypothetical protein
MLIVAVVVDADLFLLLLMPNDADHKVGLFGLSIEIAISTETLYQ